MTNFIYFTAASIMWKNFVIGLYEEKNFLNFIILDIKCILMELNLDNWDHREFVNI